MSWWNPNNITSIATQALKTAQKKIDKVLDIKEDTGDSIKENDGESFFNKWLTTEKQSLSSSVIENKSHKEEESEAFNTKSNLETSYEERTLTRDVIERDSYDSESDMFKFKENSAQKQSTIGSKKSAFKKFKDIKEQPLESSRICVSYSEDKSFKNESFLNKSLTITDDSIERLTPLEDKICRMTPDKFESQEIDAKLIQPVNPIINSTSIDNIELNKIDESPFCGGHKSNETPTAVTHNFPSISSDDVSGCWNGGATSQMELSLLEESGKDAADKTRDEHHHHSSYNDKDGGFDGDNCKMDSKELDAESSVVELAKLEDPKTEPHKDETPHTGGDKTPSRESPCIIAATVTDHSLENSTCASDDLSESNKTITGDDGNGPSSNFTNLAEFDQNIIIVDEVEEAEVAKPDSPTDITKSPDVVQGMIEEAMKEEGGAKDDSDKSGDDHETRGIEGQVGDKTNPEVTLPAESGQTSGHTSADEIDTTTSSDIEIISHMSTPSFLGSSWTSRPTGDKCSANASSCVPTYCDLSPPSKRIVIRTGSPSGIIGHRRSDSGSSGQSLQSRNGEDFVSIDYASNRAGFVDIRHRKCLPIDISHQLTSMTNENDSMIRKISEMEEILEAREKKVLELSQQNMDFRETNITLRNQLAHEESVNEAEKEDLRSMSEEFMRRISDSEKRFQAAVKEKEALKKATTDAEAEKRSNNILMDKLMREKDQTIAELMAEGEKLSKQQLQVSTAVKKLRAKDKENETTIKSLRDTTSEQKCEIERLEDILDSKMEAEKKYVDSINQLNSILKSNEEEMNRLKNDLEDAQEKSRSFKLALDNSYKEMSELHKARMSDITQAQKVAASVELSVKEELMKSLDEQKVNARRVENQLVMQIEDLQLSMTRMEKEHGRREDALRQEISDLQQRLQEAEERNQELTRSVSTATRPLLRQIENIQSTFAVQSSNFERIERNLSDRLAETQNQLVSAVEKERISNENLMDLSSRLNSLDIQVSSLRQDKARLQAELEMERSKLGALEETKHIMTAQKDTLIKKHEDEIKELKKEKIMLENQVEMERMKSDVEKKKNIIISDQLKEKEIQLQNSSLKSTPTPQPSEDIIRFSTSSTPTNDEYQEKSMSRSFYVEGGGRHSVYESLRGASGSTIIENLQSQLKQRQGEIAQLLSNISELERTRESLSRELVAMSMANEELQDKLECHDEMEKQFNEVSARHNALLQMYGEKVEEVNELRMDLQDIKEIYKCQMDELLKLKTKHIPS